MIEPPEVFYGLKRQLDYQVNDITTWYYPILDGGFAYAKLQVENQRGEWTVRLYLLFGQLCTEIHHQPVYYVDRASDIDPHDLETAMLSAMDSLKNYLNHCKQRLDELQVLVVLAQAEDNPTLWERLS